MPPTLSSPADAPPAGDADRLWVVLPVYNEAAAIERVVAEWIPVLSDADPGFVLLIVDDGSTDETPSVLARLARAEPRVRLVRQGNRGHGAACRRGYELAAAGQPAADFVLQIDSDGQCDPGDFAPFWAARHDHPRQLGRRRRRGDGWLRAVTSRALAWLVTAVTGRRIHDPNVPYRLLRRDALADALGRLHGEGAVGLANAALSVVLAETGPVRWIDIGFRQRHSGQSHYRAGRMARLAGELLWWSIAGRGPSARARRSALLVRAAALTAWCALAAGAAVHAGRNLHYEALWYDEAMQVHTSLGVYSLAPPFTPAGSLRDVLVRNPIDQLDPGGFGVLLHAWMRVFGTTAAALRALSGLLVLAGLVALAALAYRWIPHPLAPPAAIGFALLDPLVREQALEVRPYALELAGVWLAFLAGDRLLAQPGMARAWTFGLVLVALLGSRYSAFLTGAALAGAAVVHVWARGARSVERSRTTVILTMLAAPAVGLALIARASLPGLWQRASWNEGALVSYLDPYTAAPLGLQEAVVAALRHLVHPAVLGVTLAAGLAVWPGLRGAPAAPSSRFVQRTALVLLILTVLLWPWHPWDPATKWSLYLRLVAIVCVLRLVADVLAWMFRRPVAGRAMLAGALAVIALGAGLTATHVRGRWDVAFPALVRLGDGLAGGASGVVAVDIHPTPAVRYHYEFGALRGRPEYPRAFQLPLDGREVSPEAMCRARWLVSFEPIARLEERYPGFRFERDTVADQLLRVVPAAGSSGPPCEASGPAIDRASSGAAR